MATDTSKQAPELQRFNCLLLEDHMDFASMAAEIIVREGGRVVHCASIKEAREAIQREAFDLALLDNRLPDGTGYDFFPHLLRQLPNIVAVMTTAEPELANAVTMTRNGLFDYLSKPISVNALSDTINRAKQRLYRTEEPANQEMSGESPVIREVLQMLNQAARHPTATVLLIGETGTGKDLAARTLHRLTHPHEIEKAPYIALNCSTLPEAMFEAELFGAEKGAYTGADKRRIGLSEATGHGTLLLDEIGEVPILQQPKLLRFLESREFRPIGSPETRKFHGRVVAATNRLLLEEVIAGRLRADLMYRLDVFTVRLPPLRERIDDLSRIATALVHQLASRYGRKAPFIQPSDLRALHEYDFPGNIRELRNILERSLLKTPEDANWLTLDLGWLYPRNQLIAAPSTSRPAPESPPPAAPPPPPAAPPEDLPPPPHDLTSIELQEYRLVQKTLREENGAIRRTAARLGITHQALLRRLQKWPELRPNSGDSHV